MPFETVTICTPLLPPDMSHWIMRHRQQPVANDETTINASEDDFLGLYFNIGNAHGYKIHGFRQGIIHQGRYNLVYLPKNSWEITLPKSGYSAFTFQITPAYLQLIASGFETFQLNEKLGEFITCVALKTPASLSNINLQATPHMLRIIQRDKENKTYLKGIVKAMYRQSQMTNLLFSCFEHMDDYSKASLHKTELVRLRAAHRYVIQNLNTRYPTSVLADLVQLDEQRLEEGFKVVYGDTIAQLQRYERITIAKTLLLTTRLTEKKIALQLGYPSTSTFSKDFTSYYGYSPTCARQRDNFPDVY
jgi:AraC-like DNA-binding protein